MQMDLKNLEDLHWYCRQPLLYVQVPQRLKLGPILFFQPILLDGVLSARLCRHLVSVSVSASGRDDRNDDLVVRVHDDVDVDRFSRHRRRSAVNFISTRNFRVQVLPIFFGNLLVLQNDAYLVLLLLGVTDGDRLFRELFRRNRT